MLKKCKNSAIKMLILAFEAITEISLKVALFWNLGHTVHDVRRKVFEAILCIFLPTYLIVEYYNVGYI